MGILQQEYWNGLPCPPPGDLPNPRFKPRSPALQVDSLLSEPPGKPKEVGGGVSVTQSCPILCNPMDCSPLGASVHGISQTRMLEWIDMSFSRGSSRPRDRTWVSCISGRFFTVWATREALLSLRYQLAFSPLQVSNHMLTLQRVLTCNTASPPDSTPLPCLLTQLTQPDLVSYLFGVISVPVEGRLGLGRVCCCMHSTRKGDLRHPVDAQ